MKGAGFWLVAIVSSLIIFFNLGGIALLDPDEPVYAETPKEMIQFQDFISPRIYGEYWYDKPPMYYWLAAGSFQVFGANEFAARFPSAVLAVVCVLGVYLAGKRLFHGQAGLAAALVLLTSIEYFYLAKAAVTDITLTLFLTFCLWAYMEQKYYWMYLFAGLATVTKGPIGFLFPGAIIFLYMLFTRSFGEMKRMKVFSGALLFAVAAVPWYWMMYSIHGKAFIDTFIGFNNITRFTSPEHPEGVLWYYFIPVLIVGFFPWSAVLLQSVWASFRDSKPKESSRLLFLNIWAWFIFLFFSISQTKLVSYILPVFPPLAMITGWYLSRLWQQRRPGRNIGWSVILTGLVTVLTAGLLFAVKTMPELSPGAMVSAGIFILMTLAVWFYNWRRDSEKAFWSQVAGITLFSLVLVTLLFPAVAPRFSTKTIAREFVTRYDGQSPVYIMKFLHPGFTFYSNIYGKELKAYPELEQKLASQHRAYFVMRQQEYKSLPENLRSTSSIIAEAADKVVIFKK
ncbi:dolichyl-phosphate-mannose-protein mannosyltransferase [Lucifera butyrica]|uniref:Dolichyl-phosphate-mannose-protein mannosyltransferase n=1 Tax=Lucifera butyrica TaxID=1351585 RepID=A0A498R7E8_9FIRM|nr:glycosyltransferase family 39 protein [Lucifera butyrica]VBB06850.1 dolichyl-phosphate-mannose-protein mannosyltransferase [Lucifera butyrica]